MLNLKISLPILISVVSLSACSGGEGYDKEKHFLAGAAVSYIVEKKTGSKLAGCAASLGIGVLKEHIDHNRDGRFDTDDLGATAAGCSVTFVF